MKNFTQRFIGLLSITFTLFISQSYAQVSLHINTFNNDVYFYNSQSYNIPISEFNLVSSTPWGVTTTSGVVFSYLGCSNETFGDGTSAYMCYAHSSGGVYANDTNQIYDLNGVSLHSDTYGGGIHNNHILINYSSSDQANGVPFEPTIIGGAYGTYLNYTISTPGSHHLAYMAPQTIEYIYAEANMGNGMISIPVYINGLLLEQDCAGTWGGSSVNDFCGVCNGDNSSCSGCTYDWASNYDPTSTLNDGSCELSGCTDQTALNYNQNATDDDGSCIATTLGCMDVAAVNYDANANTDNGTCQPYTLADVEAAVAAAEAAAAIHISESYTTGFSEGAASVTPEDGIGQEDVDAAYAEGIAYASPILVNATLDLSEGWGMFGYTCINPVDAMIGFSSITDKIEIVKDYLGNAYLPEWGFNGIGSLEFARGYQIKMIEAVDDFHFCQTHALKVYGCMNETALNFNPDANTDDSSCSYPGCTDAAYVEFDEVANTDDGSCLTVIIEGCIDETAFNYNANANTDDGYCIAVVMGCLDETAFNYNTNANTDDGYCIPVIEGCTDSNYEDFNPNANVDDGSCLNIIESSCTEELACNYNINANIDESDINDCDFSCYGCVNETACNYNTSTQLPQSIFDYLENEEGLDSWETDYLIENDIEGFMDYVQDALYDVMGYSNYYLSGIEDQQFSCMMPYINDFDCDCSAQYYENMEYGWGYNSYQFTPFVCGDIAMSGNTTGYAVVDVEYPCVSTGYWSQSSGYCVINITLPNTMTNFTIANTTGSVEYNVYYNSNVTTIHQDNPYAPNVTVNLLPTNSYLLPCE